MSRVIVIQQSLPCHVTLALAFDAGLGDSKSWCVVKSGNSDRNTKNGDGEDES